MRGCVSFAAAMALSQPAEGLEEILFKFPLHMILFGSFMGLFMWTSLKSKIRVKNK
jgi:hypothetical protein